MEHEPKKLRTDKLVDVTSLEWDSEKDNWEKNKEVFRATEELDHVLEGFPQYVGVIPLGSQMKGYSSKKNGSDLDVYLLYDLTREVEVEKMDEAIIPVKNKYEELGLSIQIFHMPLDERFLFENHRTMSLFAQPGRGKRLQEWRERAKAVFSKLDNEEQRRKFENMLQGCFYVDRISCAKIRSRIPDFDEEAWLFARKKLWEDRLRKLYFTENNS